MELVERQLAFGPRYPGSPGHQAVGGWIESELQRQGWEPARQSFEHAGLPLANIIGRGGGVRSRLVLLGAHYDTRPLADESGSVAPGPVPGANDGASGVAVLLELARALEPTDLECEVWLVFFDAEDSGRLPGWDWILGSSYFVANLEREPEAVVIVDMVGDRSLQLPLERNSDPALQAEIWEQAARLGYEAFESRPGHSMLDDHTPFLRRGLAAVDIIDFDYRYWHTEEDTIDKVSSSSLQAVGHTLESWLEKRCQTPGN